MNLFAALHEYLLERERQDYFSGVVLITQNSHELYSAAYGYASRAWKVMNSLDIRFDCASVTKIFTAVAVLQLIEQGLLTLETSAVQLLGLRDTQISEAVNVFHLLTHTSGIADDSEEEAGEDYADLWITKPNYSVLETADFLPQFVHKPPNFAPGAGCRYCNVGFTLLGLMIEKVTGMTYRSYVRKHVFERAEMWHSDFYRMDVVTENVAEGCDPIVDGDNTITGWKRNIYSYPPIGSPDGGAHVTAGDLDIFLNAIQSGKLLSAEFTADMLVPKALHHETEHYTFKCGYGLEFYLWKPDIFTYYEKDGINAGASAVMRHYPAQNLNVIMLSNMMRGVWEPVKKVHELLMTTAL